MRAGDLRLEAAPAEVGEDARVIGQRPPLLQGAMAVHVFVALAVSHLMLITMILHFIIDIDIIGATVAAFFLFSFAIGFGALARRMGF